MPGTVLAARGIRNNPCFQVTLITLRTQCGDYYGDNKCRSLWIQQRGLAIHMCSLFVSCSPLLCSVCKELHFQSFLSFFVLWFQCQWMGRMLEKAPSFTVWVYPRQWLCLPRDTDVPCPPHGADFAGWAWLLGSNRCFILCSPAMELYVDGEKTSIIGCCLISWSPCHSLVGFSALPSAPSSV